MRVIIIQDKDAEALVASLELAKLRTSSFGGRLWANGLEIAADVEKALVENAHRHFHFVVVRWLQEQGWRR